MDRQGRRTRNLAVIAVAVAILGMSVGFAALQQSLAITGTGTVRSATWGISFSNLQPPVLVGATVDTPAQLAVNSTTLTFAVSLHKPGDSVQYNFDVRNNGTIDARISSVNITGISEAAAANITYSLTYADGSPIAVNDTLAQGASRNLRLTLTYQNVSVVPDQDIILNVGATINYIQD